MNGTVFPGIFSTLLLSCHVDCSRVVIYMFVNYRHWHSEHERLLSFTKYLLSTFCVLAAVLGISNIMVKRTAWPLQKLNVCCFYFISTSGPGNTPLFTGRNDDNKFKFLTSEEKT